VPDQQQIKPAAENYTADDKQMSERGSTRELPANWPAALSLPDGYEIKEAASRSGIDTVSFKVGKPMLEVNAGIAADASASGFKLRQADVDKFTQARIYTDASRQFSSTLTDVEGECHGTYSLTPLVESQYYSESTHYTGEFELPGNWPQDILPIYEGCVLRELHIPLGSGGRLMLSAQSNADEADVIAWLEEQLPMRGWTPGKAFSRNGFLIREFTGNGYNLNVAARSNDGLTDIQYEGSSS